MLTNQANLQDLDPQRVYTGADIAFTNAYLSRSLTAFQLSTDGATANTIVPDMATDTGRSSDSAKTWAFTIRDGVTWQDGTPVTCADIKYGVSRTFATSLITNGPQYAVNFLDIPKAKDGSSIYKGPYDTKADNTAGAAAFDKAIDCSADGKTITFHLGQSVGDFNYAVTLGFSPVQKAKDTGVKYTDAIQSNGPYMIQEYVKGKDLVLVRNPAWSQASDPLRPAYPDKIVTKFGIDSAVLDQTMIKNAFQDQQTLSRDQPLTANLPTIFDNKAIASRAFNGYDPYTIYIAVNVLKVPILKQRMAIAAALDRGALLTIAGGKYAGGPADGAIKPNIGQDYKPTGMWTGLLGQPIPLSGDPAYAKQLVTESGKPMPPLVYSYAKSPDADKAAAAIQESEAKANIKITLNPLPPGDYYGIVLNKDRATALSSGGWGADWPNASTVIPDLFTPDGGFDLSFANDPAFNAAAAAGRAETDRAKQAADWQTLNTEVSKNVWIIPTRFGLQQGIAGSKVHSASGPNGAVYLWQPYGCWPFMDLYVTK
jgi:peptide/nickel transport system substrate-binding protein